MSVYFNLQGSAFLGLSNHFHQDSMGYQCSLNDLHNHILVFLLFCHSECQSRSDTNYQLLFYLNLYSLSFELLDSDAMLFWSIHIVMDHLLILLNHDSELNLSALQIHTCTSATLCLMTYTTTTLQIFLYDQ